MKTISLNSVKSYLSRDEMRTISGSGGPIFGNPDGCQVIQKCNFNSQCGNEYCNRCIPSPFEGEAGYCAT